MTERVVITVDLGGDDSEKAGEVYDGIEALLYRMGEIGTLSMRLYLPLPDGCPDKGGKPMTNLERAVGLAQAWYNRGEGRTVQPQTAAGELWRDIAMTIAAVYEEGRRDAVEAAASLIERNVEADRDAYGRFADHQKNMTLDGYAKAIRALAVDNQ